MKHKILIVVNEFQNIISFRVPLINFLIKNKFNVEVICNSTEKNEIKEFKKKFNIKIHILRGDSKGINLLKEIVFITKLLILIKNINPHLIMSFTIKPNLYSSIISKIISKNNLITITGLGSTFIEKSLINKIAFLFFKISNHRKIYYIFQNNKDKQVFVEKKICLNNISFVIPGSGVDILKYKKNINFIQNIKSDDEFNFLFIGRLIKHKGIEELFKAGSKLILNTNKKINFIIVGRYDPFDKYTIDPSLYNSIKNCKSFHLIGFTNEVKKYILKSHCVLLTSKREGMSMSLLESGSIGRPLIAPDVPGCREIVIENYNGFKYKSGEYTDLYKKMIKMINLNHRDLLQFGINSNHHVSKNFSSTVVNDKYLKIINKLI